MNSQRLYTATMAKVYADQGYLRKAAEIYQHLLEKEPHREDLQLALKKIKEKIEHQPGPSRKELGMLLREWVELLGKQKEMKRK